MQNKYKVQFQAFDSALAVVGYTDDLAFARQVMLAAYARLCTPGQEHVFLNSERGGVVRDARGSNYANPTYRLAIYEPIVALYEVSAAADGTWKYVDSIGWTEEGAE